MKKLILFLLLNIFGIQIKAQSLNFPIRVTYEMNAFADSTNLEKKRTEMVDLFINGDQAMFRSQRLGLTIDNLANGVLRGYKTIFNMEIAWKNSTIKYYDSYQYPVGYTEFMESLAWNLVDENKTILGHNCQKATLLYGGREWEAWFTFDIPYPYGPYKFGNLPGLILEMKDSKNEWNFIVSHIDTQSERRILVSKYYNKPSSVKLHDSKELLNYLWEKNATAVDRFIASGGAYPTPEREQAVREANIERLNEVSNWIEVFR